MAYITMTSRSANSITVRIRKLSEQTSAYQYFKITCSNGFSEEWHDAYDYGDGVNSGYYTSTDKTFTNLSPSTRYTFTAKAKYLGVWYDVKESTVSSWSFWTDEPAVVRPNNWHWTTSESNALNYRGNLSAITYSRWNSFLDRINEFRIYKGYSVVSFNKMSSWDKTLTASRFNEARQAISAMYSTGINTVYSGNIVYGSYFITLQNSLNSIT